MSERPLHVRVADAIGWTDLGEVEVSPFGPQWMGMPPPDDGRQVVTVIDRAERSITFGRGPATVDRYDTDWAAGGPLIERFGIRLFVLAGPQGWTTGYALRKDGSLSLPGEFAYNVGLQGPTGATPLEAVCLLILSLHAAGKLPEG